MIEEAFLIRAADLEEARSLVEPALPVRLEMHDSMHWGGDYFLGREGNEQYRLFVNKDFEGEPIIGGVDVASILLLVDRRETTCPVVECLDPGVARRFRLVRRSSY